MALQCLRLRRALPLLNTKRALSSAITNTCPKPTFDLTQPHQHQNNNQWRLFRSSAVLLSIPIPPRPRPSSYNRDNNYDQISSEEKISPDAILFEGCDYNHWLITMDFPKDPKPSPEEMVETYVQTAAKVLGSVEEAKKKIYACSTTTYQGFQVEVTEEMSEKFRGLPGVVFILPDSYIDPVNKEYGGDKYVNGTIIPRPPPVQYGRNQGGRFNDRNRDFNRPNRPRGQYQQGNAPYDNQGPMQGNFGAQQNAPPPQYSGPPRDFRAQQNIPPPQFSGPPREFGGQHNPPPQFSGPPREFGAQQNHPPPQFSGPPRDFGAQHNPPPPQFSAPPRDFMAQQNSTAPKFPIPPRSVNNGPGGWDNYQRDRREPVPSYQANYNQGETGHYHQGQRDFQSGDQRNYAPPQGGNYGQGAGGIQGQESGYIQSDMGHGENQRFSQRDPRDSAQGQQRNYEAVGDTGTSQGRY